MGSKRGENKKKEFAKNGVNIWKKPKETIKARKVPTKEAIEKK